MLDAAKVALHNSRRSCWIIIHGRVYDVTDFLDEHPGGASTILKFAGHVGPTALSIYITTDKVVGQDATDDYAQIHPPNMVLEGMSVGQCPLVSTLKLELTILLAQTNSWGSWIQPP
jgi:L-lactate dehydrogenase (cytochrome)